MTLAGARLRRGVWLTLLFVAATLVMLSPTPRLFTTSLPANLGDPALITWIMHWQAHALLADPLDYFTGNIYWPNPSSLAYSDLVLPFVPVYGVAYGASGNWALALNLSVVAGFVGSLAAAYGLAQWLTRRTDAALVAAFAFTFTGPVVSQWGHIQLNTVATIPLSALLLGLVLERRRLWAAALLGVVTGLVTLGAVYYGLIWTLSVGVIAGGYVLLKRGRPGPRFVRCMAVAALTGAVVVGPAAYKYLELQRTEGHRRGLEPANSLKLRDLATPAHDSYVWDDLLDPGNNAALSEHGHFPGASVALLGLGGLAVAMRRGRRAIGEEHAAGEEHSAGEEHAAAEEHAPGVVDPDARWLMLVLLGVAGVVAVVLALGGTWLGALSPYRYVHEHVPGFSGIRVTARFVIVGVLALTMLAGVGYRALAERITSRRAAAAVAAVALVVVCADLAAPLGWARLPTDRATLAVYRALDRKPEGPVLELPMIHPGQPGAQWAYVESPRMVYSTIDWNPRVNGYSGFAPKTYHRDVEVFRTFPAPLAWQHARALNVRYLIVHIGTENGFPSYTEDEARRIVDGAPPGAAAERHGRAWLVDLGPSK